MAKPVEPCWKCKKAITDGNFLNIADMSYHAACFECVRCATNVYGKNFVPSGDPRTPEWKIYCARCDPYAEVDISFEDQRAEAEKKAHPTPLPRQAKQRPDASSSVPLEDPVPKGTVRALSQINEAKKAEKERQERLESLQKQDRIQTGERRQREIETSKAMKAAQMQEEQDVEQELRRLRQSTEDDDQKRRNEVKRQEEQRRARVEAENAGMKMEFNEPLPDDAPEEKKPVGRLNANQLNAIGSPNSSAASAGGPPPPPPPIGGTPPPPPPGKAGAAPRAAPSAPSPSGAKNRPPATEERGALLNSIQGFNSGQLRSAKTNDRSAPATSSSSSSGDGSTSPRKGPGGAGAGPMSSIAAMAAAAAAARK